ncbi:MAG: hypothetical protein BIP78_1527 [Candidatus Bipolaricaulis sibiricus]|uniref:Uncharacterized protein n=1 Tax=Bipolaricaulis sibiricus TaxID=2501609 RepID=A0A410FW90_BIPS1|nr:MAG: hypothetical protein BIP78_1527 [Candidatus Bipolaricaulis sibiricus]
MSGPKAAGFLGVLPDLGGEWDWGRRKGTGPGVRGPWIHRE